MLEKEAALTGKVLAIGHRGALGHAPENTIVSYRIYGRKEATEQYRCNYGLNPAYRDKLAPAGLRISGVGTAG
jgi:CTP synthase (UTP-ammonia lyase)